MYTVSFANFICTFGATKVLMDYAEEVVLPAFLDTTLVRTYGEANAYFFFQTELIPLERGAEREIAIAGHFIKDTVLRRTQIFDPDGGLVQDEAQLSSAPSAFFLLLLSNHKLIYAPETPYAPDLGSFAATAGSFLRRKHKDFIDKLHDQARQRGERIAKKDLVETHPKPLLMVVSLASAASIDEFIKQYERLEAVQFTLIKPNQEIDGQALWRGLREAGRLAKAEQTRVEHKNKDGLDREATASQIHDAAAAGNQVVQLYGRDGEGNVLRGNNDQFRLRVPVAELPEEHHARADRLYGLFNHLVETEVVRVDAPAEMSDDLLRRLGDGE
jgi:hypothetical protein